MKIAVIADVHSNIHSLNAVLEDIAAEKPDLIAGAGDMVGSSAYSGSQAVWDILHDRKIPLVLGNEEERILRFHDPAPDELLKNSIQFMPMRYRARQFSSNQIEAMRSLPTSLLLDGHPGPAVFICHASPGSLDRSPMLEIDPHMQQELNAVPAGVVVVGHLHTTWHQYWQGKLLVMAGSAGLPLRGRLDEVDYLLLTWSRQAWHFVHKTVKYDHQAAVRDALQSDFLAQSGPIGWLMFDEILTQVDRLVPFLGEYCPTQKPDDLENWKKLVVGYLASINRWEALKSYVQDFL